jgi:hypothetical protein
MATGVPCCGVGQSTLLFCCAKHDRPTCERRRCVRGGHGRYNVRLQLAKAKLGPLEPDVGLTHLGQGRLMMLGIATRRTLRKTFA